MGVPGKLRPSRQKFALMALLVGSMTILSHNHASFKLLLLNEQDLGLPSDLILPASSEYGAWSLTLQLLTPEADLIKKPQTVSTVTRELERVVSHVSLRISRQIEKLILAYKLNPQYPYKKKTI
jgi:hypothetical protein